MSGGLFINALLRETDAGVTAEQVARIQSLHAKAYTTLAPQVRPLPGARELLTTLTAAGVPWGIATSGRWDVARPVLDTLGAALAGGGHEAVGLVSPLRRASDADARRKEPRDGDPGPAPPKCSKLYGKCFVNSDCCSRGARCDRTGRNRCLCKRGRAICKPQGTCCPNGQVCCGRCADLKTSSDHCGACGAACAVGEVCVGGICTT